MSERPPISPRSPRAALEPEQVPPPPKRSERARNPFVIVGNAIITIILVFMLGAGGVYVYGKKMLESAGPLAEDKTVNIPPRSKTREIAETLQREGVIDINPWLFMGAAFALKASSELKPGEYSFQKNASLRDLHPYHQCFARGSHTDERPKFLPHTAAHPSHYQVHDIDE